MRGLRSDEALYNGETGFNSSSQSRKRKELGFLPNVVVPEVQAIFRICRFALSASGPSVSIVYDL